MREDYCFWSWSSNWYWTCPTAINNRTLDKIHETIVSDTEHQTKQNCNPQEKWNKARPTLTPAFFLKLLCRLWYRRVTQAGRGSLAALMRQNRSRDGGRATGISRAGYHRWVSLDRARARNPHGSPLASLARAQRETVRPSKEHPLGN